MMRSMVERLTARLVRYRWYRAVNRQFEDMSEREFRWFSYLVIVLGLTIGLTIAVWLITTFDIPRGTP